MNKPLIALTAVLAILFAGGASAALSIVDGAPGVTPGDDEANDVLGDGVTWDGYYNGNVSVDEDTTLRFEFEGYEADYVNTFSAGSGTFVNNTASVGDTFDVEVGAGVIPFSFSVQDTGTGVSNGSNNPDIEGDQTPNFFLSFANSTDTDNAETESPLWVFLDDGGFNDDDNHDDLVVSISEVPEPGMLALLGIGLLGAGIAARRRC